MKVITQREYVPYEKNVTITEKRAPTDESIKLVREYEDKAMLRASAALIEAMPSIEAAYAVIERDPMDNMEHIFFKLNGKIVRMKIETLRTRDTRERIKDIADKISTEIVKQLMAGNLR